ncbi:quinol dehydrogenase ferredoxin subunit NapH [Methylophilus sp. QUAN]|uniref:quinol dehydrogenase ferredoxin subunit NapH n=1 Tax=Methylophilus sp. QUAN TaxID=2781020 RepID=UPI00188FE0E1|nr:quinol dehydrogenase ferredoxin subunit NapH [Methylophilus sp. QUAN]MBF4992015.1 quinol dehydrogenase ferredoxin subunit NapH [Methylophilus sp. QUAN]
MRRLQAVLYRNRWLFSRRIVQLLIIAAFAVELAAGGYFAQGNLSSSVWFGIGLTDPYIWLQSLFAGAPLGKAALIGVVIVAVFYLLLGGRIYCSWVCPINLVTDLSYWLRQKLNIKSNYTLSKNLRVAILVLSLLLSLLSGTLAWETINPITLFQRELMWGSVAGATVLASIFLFDIFVTRRGWCSHICPVGAFYSELGRVGRLRVKATQAGACHGCAECIKVCPEPHVLAPVVSKKATYVTHGDCTRCGACLDQCSTGALAMNLSFKKTSAFKGIPVVSSD